MRVRMTQTQVMEWNGAEWTTHGQRTTVTASTIVFDQAPTLEQIMERAMFQLGDEMERAKAQVGDVRNL